MNRPPQIVPLGIAFILACLPVRSAAFQVWTSTQTQRFTRSHKPERLQATEVFLARNETRGFQLLVHSAEPYRIEGLEVEMEGPEQPMPPGLAIRTYRQHQLPLATGTYSNDAFKPDGYPDPLIPLDTPQTPAGPSPPRFRGVPFNLPQNQTHGFYIEIHAARDARPGDFSGVVRLRLSDKPPVPIPFHVRVWNFALPDAPTLQTEFGSPDSRLLDHLSRNYPGWKPSDAEWAAIEDQSATLASEHRLNAVPPGRWLTPVLQPNGSYQIPETQASRLRQFARRHPINALRIPSPAYYFKDPQKEEAQLVAWLDAFTVLAKNPEFAGVLFYTYLKDEPDSLEDYRYVQRWGPAIRNSHSVVKVLVVEQPWTTPGDPGADSAWGTLHGSVDIWCPLFSKQNPVHSQARQSQGEIVWAYTALCQGKPTPYWHLDFPLLNYRVPLWAAWHQDIKGLLYRGGMAYWKEAQDPWTQAPYYRVKDPSFWRTKTLQFFGEGCLVYPADPLGYLGVVSSLRLKALRDGIQDYDYLALLARAAGPAESKALCASLAPSFFEWKKDPLSYESARARIASILLSKIAPADGPPTTRSPSSERGASEPGDHPSQ